MVPRELPGPQESKAGRGHMPSAERHMHQKRHQDELVAKHCKYSFGVDQWPIHEHGRVLQRE